MRSGWGRVCGAVGLWRPWLALGGVERGEEELLWKPPLQVKRENCLQLHTPPLGFQVVWYV